MKEVEMFFTSSDIILWAIAISVVLIGSSLITQYSSRSKTPSSNESVERDSRLPITFLLSIAVFGALGVGFLSFLPTITRWWGDITKEASATPDTALSRFSHVPTPPLPPGGNWKRIQLLPRETSPDIATHGRRVEFLGPEGYNFIVLFVDTAGDSCMSWECKPGHYPRFRVLNIAKNWKKNPQKDHNEFIENVVWYRLL